MENKNQSVVLSEKESSSNLLDQIRSHPLVSKLKTLFVWWVILTWAIQSNAQDLKNAIEVDSNYIRKVDNPNWPGELLQKIRANQELIRGMKCHLDETWYEWDSLSMATQIVESANISLDTRSVHNIHISFRLPDDVTLGSTYVPALIDNINDILTNTYNPLRWEDYHISGYDIKKLPPNYYIPWYGTVDLTLAGNSHDYDILNSMSAVKTYVGETCLVVVVVPNSAGSDYHAWLANWINWTNSLNTVWAVTVMKSWWNSEIVLGPRTRTHEVLGHLAWFYYPWWPNNWAHSSQTWDYMTPGTWSSILSDSQANIAADLWPDGGWDVTECTTYPLPLEFVEFWWESVDESTNIIRWEVAQEHDIEWYEVEYSIDGISRDEIWYVSATNQTTQQSYTYTHNDAPISTYYRIRSIGKDDQDNYTKIIHISKKWKESFVAYPNPANRSIYVELKWSNWYKSTLEVYNILWQKVHSQDMQWSEDRIDIDGLSDGVYSIQATTSDGHKYSQKIIKN